jgi:hypothetical protein
VECTPSKKRSNISPQTNPCSPPQPEECAAHPHSERRAGESSEQPLASVTPDTPARAAADASAEAAASSGGQDGTEGADGTERNATQFDMKQAEMDHGEFAADDTQRELEDANTAAEELLRVCFTACRKEYHFL